MKALLKITASFVGMVLAVSSVMSAEPAGKITYVDHVLPTLRDKCIGCHNAEKAKGGLDLSTYFKVMAGGSSGEVVKAGDVEASRLYMLAAHKEEPKMPPSGGQMSADGLAILKKWIETGALENSGSKAPLMNKPKADLALKTSAIAKPEVPPMPTKLLPQDGMKTTRPIAVTAMASNPWSPLVAIASAKQVLLFHADTMDLLGVLPFNHGQVNVLKFSRNGSLLLAAGGRGGKSGKAVVWNVASGETVFELGDETDAVLACDINPDQTQIAMGGPGKIVRIYSTADGQVIRQIKKHTDWVTALEYSSDGKYLASADRSAGLIVWEAATGREHQGLRGHTLPITDVSWRPDGQILASCSEDGTVRQWEMENGKQVKSWNAHGGGVQSVRYAMDGKIVTSGRDKVAKIWDANGTAIKAFEAFPDLALRAVPSFDSARVISGDWTGLVRGWTVADGKRYTELSTNPMSPADRLANATKSLTTAEAALQQATTSFQAAKAAADKANQELAAAQKLANDTTNVAMIVAEVADGAKAAHEKAQAAVAAAKATAAVRDLKAKTLGETAAKFKEALAKTPNQPELTQAIAEVEPLVAKAAADLAAAQKAVQDAEAAAKAPAQRWASVSKAVNDTAGPAQKATADATAKTATAKKANEALAAVKPTVDRLTAEVAALRATIDRLKAAPVASK